MVNITSVSTITITTTNANNFHSVNTADANNLVVSTHSGTLGSQSTTSVPAFTTCSMFYPVEATNGLEDTEAIENTYLVH